MAGVVSLLDMRRSATVERLWAELAREFGVRGVYETPFPHFSYHVADSYDAFRLRPILTRVCQAYQPFHVRTGGLGVFTGSRPVLYVPVVRDPALVRMHADLWAALESEGIGVQEHYAPENWIPHITIGFGDLDADVIGHIVSHLSTRDFAWGCEIDNVTLIDNSADDEAPHLRFTLGTGECVLTT
ncbi:MAG: 2'-5' RNA ligase family protein [Dehalococcoidia bacterium]